jgi:integral membrane sensor domain MASE1
VLAGHDPAYIRLVWLVASAFGAIVLVALIVVYRRAMRRHELEHAERVIAEHDAGAG